MTATSLVESPVPSPGARAERELDWRSLTPVAAGLEAALVARAPGAHAGTPLVRKLAAQVSRMLGLDDHDTLAVDICARVRDVGMISLPDYVILTTGALSAGDQALLNRHPVIGSELLQSLSTMAAAAAIVRAHHERWDGAGYPDGLRGEAIPRRQSCGSGVRRVRGLRHRSARTARGRSRGGARVRAPPSRVPV